ncbi:MAG: hypothetical protein SGJ26_17935 [Nitrospirota bacterium]|nr:hypothetical protein [Nitrospirota bacterium]
MVKKTTSSPTQPRRAKSHFTGKAVTEEGFRSLSLATVQRIKLTNPTLSAELHQALATLATNHDTQKKIVSITFDGAGTRQARVAYLTETPVWKTTYRLVLDEGVSLKKGTMLILRRLVEDRTYLVKNRDTKAKTVLIEQPYRADWKLAEPKEPTERTRDLYRFSLAVDPGKSATLRVKETLPLQESILLMESGIDQIVYYQQAKEVSQKVKEALQRLVQLRHTLDDARAQQTRLDQRTAEITAEHARIRENMQRLQQNSELYTRYVKKLDQQETELEKLRKEIETLKSTEEEHRRELQNFVMNLDVA